jgi:hypothetical protein
MTRHTFRQHPTVGNTCAAPMGDGNICGRVKESSAHIDWPEIFAERGIGGAPTAWEESAPGCWWGTHNAVNVANHAVVVDDASGLCVAAPLPPGAPAPTPQRWFTMADHLADMLAAAGWRVTCGAEGCEYRRWPCPVRVAYAITTPIGEPAGNVAGATHHRPVSAGRIEDTDG